MTDSAGRGAERIAALAALGPFFAAEAHDPGPPAAAPWRSMGELRTDPSVVRDRVTAVRGLLAAGGGQPSGAVEVRAAASVVHLGLVARLISPYLGLAVLYGEVPAGPRLDALRWQPALGGPYPLSLPASAGLPRADGLSRAAGPSEPLGPSRPVRPPGLPAAATGRYETAAAGLAREVLDGPVRELLDPFAALRVSPHILWGNAASAVNGATGMIAAARPDLAAPARALAALLLDRPPLRDTSFRTPSGAFRRRSCCLIYRAAPGGAGALCGDCALQRAVSSTRTP